MPFQAGGKTHHLWVGKVAGNFHILIDDPSDLQSDDKADVKGALQAGQNVAAAQQKLEKATQGSGVKNQAAVAAVVQTLVKNDTVEAAFLKKLIRDAQAQVTARYQSNCFVAGTPLQTAEGAKAIERFRPGDRLLARPESDPDAPAESMVVEEVFVSDAVVFSIRIGGHDVWTTTEHPFWVKGKGWVPASHLEPGDLLSSHDGQWVPVEAVNRDDLQVTTVYNLRVAEHHTYFVGCDEWGFSVWAHNSSYLTRKSTAYTLADAELLVTGSEGKTGPASNIGHSEAHLPPPGADSAAAMLHARTRMNSSGTAPIAQSTVFRNRKQALQELRDILNDNAAAINGMALGDVRQLAVRNITPRQVYYSRAGGDVVETTAKGVQATLWLDPATGRLHLLHYQPINLTSKAIP